MTRGSLTAAARDDIGDEFVEVLDDVHWNGGSFERFVSYYHLIDAFEVLSDEEITIRMDGDDDRPTRIRMDEGGLSIVVLPLRLKPQEQT